MFGLAAEMLQSGNSDGRSEVVHASLTASRAARSCVVVDAGRVAYEHGLVLQRKARDLVGQGAWDGIVLLLEHEPVITIGRNGGVENLLVGEDELKSKGVDLVMAERGGNITVHNPGQLVVYPIIDLKKWKQDIHWYVRIIEETIINTLMNFKLKAERKSGMPGVWFMDEKIAAIGIFVSRWISSHGLAININNDLTIFESIIPCGISDYGVTSLAKKGIKVEVDIFKKIYLLEFEKLFECVLFPAQLK